MKKISLLAVMLLAGCGLAGCIASTSTVGTVVLPTSNRSIDIVQHRSDVKFADCGTLVVLQTYDATGKLIDAKDARGSALHCAVIPAMIEAGGRVGGAFVGRSPVSISNSQKQGQLQLQGQQQSSVNVAQGGAGGQGGQGGQGGNNGGGNGSEDGTNNGTDNHHNNGDND